MQYHATVFTEELGRDGKTATRVTHFQLVFEAKNRAVAKKKLDAILPGIAVYLDCGPTSTIEFDIRLFTRYVDECERLFKTLERETAELTSSKR